MARRSLRFARAFVARSDDRRLDRMLGSRTGQRAFFAAMRRAYVPGALDGFTGDIVWALRAREREQPWTLHVARGRATTARGATDRPALTVRVSAADLARIAVGELDPTRALLAGRLDVEGDFAIAARLGELFGRRARGR